MTDKPLAPRAAAQRDIDRAVDDYAETANEQIALGFIDAVQAAFRMIARHPAAGSTRYAHELDLPGLRSRMVKRFPFLVLYVERADHIDVWRVLHARRDIPASLQDTLPD